MKNKYLCILLIATCSTFLEIEPAAIIKTENEIPDSNNPVNKSNQMTKDFEELCQSFFYYKSDLIKIEKLNANKVNINTRGVLGNTPLMWAIRSIHTSFDFKTRKSDNNFGISNQIIEILLRKGADVNIANNEGNTPIIELAIKKRCFDIIVDTKLSFLSRYSEHILNDQKLIEDFFKKTAKKILSKRADVNAVNNNGETALSIAVNTLNRALVEVLIEAGASIKINENKTVFDLINEKFNKIKDNVILNPRTIEEFTIEKQKLLDMEKLIKENLEFRPAAAKMFQVILQKELNNNLTNLPTDITNIISEYASDYDGYYNYLYS